MSQQRFPFPPFEPLTRLQVQDSLRINAERWLLAHNYHRQRQGMLYQSLWEPGIVNGLGVKAIAPPETTPGQFKDGRWIKIQPGLAIDVAGNPIVVADAADRTYRIAVPSPTSGKLTVYVVLRYVDPDHLELPDRGDRIVEQFRFDQRVGRLKPDDIELCRIQLVPEDPKQKLRLKQPSDPFAPNPTEIDLRYRQQAQLRPQGWINIGSLSPLSLQLRQQWQALLESMATLSPTLQGSLNPRAIAPITPAALASHTLIYASDQTLLSWIREERSRDWPVLAQYLQGGGTLLISVQQFTPALQGILQRLTRHPQLAAPPPRHPLKTQPFRFGQLPQTTLGQIELLYDQGILLVNQPLLTLWDGETSPYQDIRAAQEFGINLLHFAGRRQQFQSLLA